MKTKTNFCGIFATVFMVATAITIASCSQDDDYDSNMYTLAEKMDTRSGGDPGGGETPTPQPISGNPVCAGNDTIQIAMEEYNLETYVNWTRGYTGLSSPRSRISIVAGFFPIIPDDIFLVSTTGEWYGYQDEIDIRIRYYKDSIVYNPVTHQDSIITMVKDFYYRHKANTASDPTLQPL